MGEREAAAGQIGEDRLDVAGVGAAGGGIASWPMAKLALQILGGVRTCAPKTSPTRPAWRSAMNWPLSIGDDARRFLAAMLERMQAQHRQRAGIGMAENAEHAALFMQRVAVEDRSSFGRPVMACRFRRVRLDEPV